MNMITALLGATGLLLAAAVTLSVMKMTGNDDEAELKKIRAELAALSAQQSQLNPPAPVPGIDPSLLAPATPANPAPSPLPPAPSPEDTGEVVASPPATEPVPAAIGDTPGPEARSGDPTREELLSELAEAERERDLLKAEAEQGLISKEMIESAKKHKARASTVKAAWLQAKVVKWVDKQPDQPAGGFAIIELHKPLEPGTVLAIRRQTGIYGQLQVDFLYPENNQASANPVRGTFPDGGNPVIKPGDELILPPFGS